MAKKKLIVMAHGIGDTPEGFHMAWEKIISRNVDLSNVEVRGLWWEDVLDKVEAKYPLIDGAMADVVESCGFPDLKKWIGSDKYKLFHDYMMDVLVYVAFPDMWQYIQDECVKKLDALRCDEDGKQQYAASETILIGHSLGAAMLPHLVWRNFAFTGSMAYRGLILLASPLALVSPAPNICSDFLGRMGEIFGGSDRNNVLRRFAGAWDMGGAGRLRFISNENDIVCSDVKYKVPGKDKLVDLIPLRQGFDPAESKLLNREHAGAVQVISFGTRDPRKVVDNHDVLTYLKQPAFINSLVPMLKG